MISILFVGSLDEGSEEYDDFLDFCARLGCGTIPNFKILICGTTPRTADHSIARGALKGLGQLGTGLSNLPRIILYHTPDDESVRTRDNQLFDVFRSSSEKSTDIRYCKNYDDAFRQAIRDCDIVTIIGGGDNSAHLVDLAIENQKPVLGFTSFGGIGSQANAELHRVYQILGISGEKAFTLKSKAMDAQACSAYKDLVNHVYKSNPWSSKNALRRGAVLIAVLAALALVSIACMLISTLDGLPIKGLQFFALYASCIAMGLFGAYAVFLKQLNTPSELLLTRALPASGQGVAIGFGIAAFAQMIVGHVLSENAIAHDLSFSKLIGISSLMTFSVAAFGVRGLKKIGDVLGNYSS
jgi:hypothetical protein